MLDARRNFKIMDVELNWARLESPRDPFNQGPQFELQIATTDKAVADDWRNNYLTVKEKDGVYSVSLKRKATRADGSDNGRVRVVNMDLTPFDKVGSIGNGSRGNVIIAQFPYSYAGRKGVGSELTAVQITDYKEYVAEGSLDFDVIGDAPVAGGDGEMF